MPAPKKKAWSVYVVCCRDGTLYCGSTNDIKARIAAHDSGRGARYTRGRGPVKLVYKRRAGSKSAAMKLEARIKRLSRAEKLSLFSLAPGRPRR
ncbi:MAG TPA: GIY-YIG nuclease family protein [bacterium]|nr:GIY-YIG nuclease family protein [bacterium]